MKEEIGKDSREKRNLHVQSVVALPPHGWTIIAGIFNSGAARLVWHAANSTAIIFNAPFPNRNAMPTLNCHFNHDKSMFSGQPK